MPDTATPRPEERRTGTPPPGAPVDLNMQFACGSVGEFLDRHAADVSRGGIFVRTSDLLAVGCPVNLNLQLGNGATLLAGSGTVFWTRAADPALAESEPGMGIRFGKMTKQSQDMLSFLLAEKAQRERAADDDDGAATEFDNVRTVVANNEAPQPETRPEDPAAEFDNVRTVVARSEAQRAAARPETAAQPHDAPAAVPEVAAAVVAEVLAKKDLPPAAEPPKAEVLAVQATVAATSPPVAAQQPAGGEVSPAISEAPTARLKPSQPEARTASPSQPPAARNRAASRSQPVARRKPRSRLGIGLAIGGLVMVSAWFAIASRAVPKPTSGASTVVSADRALAIGAQEPAPSPPSVPPAPATAAR